MPFEPLQTDERLEAPAKRERDMDTVMLFGCSGFLVEAVASYGLTVWPWFVVPQMHQIGGLALAFALGAVPAIATGVMATRKFGLPGACGFAGGALASAIFMFLRLQQLVALRGNLQFPQPEYPNLWVWLVPGAFLLLVALVIAIFIPRGELSVEG